MIARAASPVLPIALLAACTSGGGSDEQMLADLAGAAAMSGTLFYEPCGVMAARHDIDGMRAEWAQSGDTVRPCEPIGAAAIAHACRIGDGELVYDPAYPGDEDRADFTGPDYEVTGAFCTPQNDERSEVLCSFTIAHDGTSWARDDHPFRHVYARMDDEISHMEMAYWVTRESCAPNG